MSGMPFLTSHARTTHYQVSEHEVESQDGLRISPEIYAKEEDLYAKEEGYEEVK